MTQPIIMVAHLWKQLQVRLLVHSQLLQRQLVARQAAGAIHLRPACLQVRKWHTLYTAYSGKEVAYIIY